MIRLYYYPDNASFAPHACLEEAGIDYELVLVDRAVQGQKAPDYLRLNPSGRIPAMTDGDLALFETAAICLYVADQNPDSGLAPAPGTAARATLNQWLIYLAATVQPELMCLIYPNRYAVTDDGETAVRTGAAVRLAEMYQLLDTAVGSGPYLLGSDFSLLDPYLTMLCRWARRLEPAPRDLPNLGPYLDRMLARDAMIRTIEQEGIEPFL